MKAEVSPILTYYYSNESERFLEENDGFEWQQYNTDKHNTDQALVSNLKK